MVLGFFLMTGLISALLASIVNSSVLQLTGMSQTAESIVVAPAAEECLKFGVVLGALRYASPRLKGGFRDTTVRQMGLGTGAVFMIVERIANGSLANLGLSLTILEQAPVHAVAAGTSILSLKGTQVTRSIIVLLPAAIVIHAVSNLSLSLQTTVLGAEILLYVELVLYWTAFAWLAYASRRRPEA
jgi:hypothetical protein